VFLVRYPNLLETAALIGAAMALLAGCARVSGRRRSWLLAAGAAAAVAAVSLGGRELARQSSREVRVTFLDVGQGDAAVIEGPRGFVALIDGGGSYDEGFDPGARVIEPYLRRRGIARVDLVVLSHPHPDHLNGLFRVLSRFQVGAVWTSGDDGRNPRYRDFLALARARGAAAPVPAPWRSSEMTLIPIGPWLGDAIAAPPGLGVNDASLVVRLSYGGRSVLFAGDLEEDGEAELVARATSRLVALASDVLKVPHHGSRTSSSAELLDGVRPELAVASLGKDNRFRFPHAEVVARYVRRNVRVLRTDEVGAVTVTLSPEGAIDTTCVRPCR
jgi:competence protein ComEC